MNLLQLQHGFKTFGSKLILNDASFAINDGEHVGVIGPNGAGKTTLFKILVGQESLDSGSLVKANQLRIGYLEQESDWNIDLIAEDYLTVECHKPLWELKQLGLEFGLTEQHFKSELRNLSGGYRMRMKLLYLIGLEPQLLLLDEPTNFLDLESLLALENFLLDYRGAFLMISHDREFLRRVTESTLEVEAGDTTKFPGNIDDYFEQKALLRSIVEAQSANQANKKKQIEDFVNRFGAKATKARQAQSRLKQLEKMEIIEVKPLSTRAKIKIPEPNSTGKLVLSLEQANLGYPDKIVLAGVSLRLNRGAHLGVVGVNGAGKSTLLKSIAQSLPLKSGVFSLGHEVSLGYFSQHSADQLNIEDTIIEALQKAADPSVLKQEILDIAGGLLFSGDDIYKKIKVLSGGEKSRVALGQVLLKKRPLLVLDEPTNHLDFETVETLTASLRDYSGTVIVVSHDRGFIGRVAQQILELREGRAEFYPGTYDEYVWSLQKGAMSERLKSVKVTDSLIFKRDSGSALSAGEIKVNYKDETKRLAALIKEKERNIRKLEEQLKLLEAERTELNEKLIQSKGQQAQDYAIVLNSKSLLIDSLEVSLLEELELIENQKQKLESFRSKV